MLVEMIYKQLHVAFHADPFCSIIMIKALPKDRAALTLIFLNNEEDQSGYEENICGSLFLLGLSLTRMISG